MSPKTIEELLLTMYSSLLKSLLLGLIGLNSFCLDPGYETSMQSMRFRMSNQKPSPDVFEAPSKITIHNSPDKQKHIYYENLCFFYRLFRSEHGSKPYTVYPPKHGHLNRSTCRWGSSRMEHNKLKASMDWLENLQVFAYSFSNKIGDFPISYIAMLRWKYRNISNGLV